MQHHVITILSARPRRIGIERDVMIPGFTTTFVHDVDDTDEEIIALARQKLVSFGAKQFGPRGMDIATAPVRFHHGVEVPEADRFSYMSAEELVRQKNIVARYL